MCGIMGYTGSRPAQPLLIEGLERLEYRGYDSAGAAVMEGDIRIAKAAGRLQHLKALLSQMPLPGTCGLGHTRWATHGEPSQLNAHPHTNTQGDVAVVHNGIIENHQQLRFTLSAQGCRFTTQTDTEVIPQLLGRLYQGDMLKALMEAASLLEGSYAIGVITTHEPQVIWCMRRHSPLVIGLGEGEQFLASDTPALLSHTRKVILMEDGQIARLTPHGVTLFDELGRQLPLLPTPIHWDAAAAEKGGWPHFMLKEIHEQPEALSQTLAAYNEAPLPLGDEAARRLRSLTIAACGTAWHAGLLGRFYAESLARLPVQVELASEFRSRQPLLGPEDLFLAISQSGETADTLAALKEAQRLGAHSLALCNVLGSSLARQAGEGCVLYTRAGPEIAVASTKAYLTQALTLLLISVDLGLKRRRIPPEKAADIHAQLTLLPAQAQRVLTQSTAIEPFVKQLGAPRIFFMGRGADHALALEASLKLKEISYLSCEAYAAGEMKHGPIALIEPGTWVVALLTQEALAPKLMANVREVKARGASILLICPHSLAQAWGHEAEVCWPLPDASGEIAPLLAMIPLQLLAYHMALHRGCDVDKPRNLAKSVTVE